MAKILIVDDSKFMRYVIKEALESGGHTVVAEAENGTDALTQYKNIRPDVVTMDVTMWGKDGIEALEEILQVDPDARIIMVSALNEQTMRGGKSNIKARAYITKPFTNQQLIDAVNSVL